MSLFARPEYVSETQAFIQQLKAHKPSLEAEQRAGRAGRLGPGVAYRLWSKLEHTL
jgi:HrpA-like RNA helicase